MAGHSKWKKVKHKKEASDQKRGKIFSKLLNAISVAARKEINPQFNPSLRAAVEQAKENLVPSDKIETAISRASLTAQNLEELLFEAYGPEGAALLISVITDSRNRSVSEIKKLLNDYGGKWAEQGSVRWAFEKTPIDAEEVWRAKFPQHISPEGTKKLCNLVDALEAHGDVQSVITNIITEYPQ